MTNFLNTHQKGEIVIYPKYIFAANNRADAFIDKVEKNIKITIITKENSNGKTIHELSYGKAKLGTNDEAIFTRGSKFKVLENDHLGDDTYEILLKEI